MFDLGSGDPATDTEFLVILTAVGYLFVSGWLAEVVFAKRVARLEGRLEALRATLDLAAAVWN